MKTFDECLDTVARNHGYKEWRDIFYPAVSEHNLLVWMKEAALLYGEAKFYEGAARQKEMCNAEMRIIAGIESEAPAPIFKP